MKAKYFMYWSGGKDSALALYKASQQGVVVSALVTTVNSSTNRIAMHGVHQSLLEQQAQAIGLPLYLIELPEMPDMPTYEESVRNVHRQLKTEGYTHAIFGDIFLEDLKSYRESLLAKEGLQCLFPLWGCSSQSVLHDFFKAGFKALTVCINSALLPKDFCGRELNESFVENLPPGVDACGENGEFHSFVYNGPLFAKQVCVEKGQVVFKDYPSPRATDCFTAAQPSQGFWFQDLLPNP